MKARPASCHVHCAERHATDREPRDHVEHVVLLREDAGEAEGDGPGGDSGRHDP